MHVSGLLSALPLVALASASAGTMTFSEVYCQSYSCSTRTNHVATTTVTSTTDVGVTIKTTNFVKTTSTPTTTTTVVSPTTVTTTGSTASDTFFNVVQTTVTSTVTATATATATSIVTTSSTITPSATITVGAPATPQPKRRNLLALLEPRAHAAAATCGISPRGQNFLNHVSCVDNVQKVHATTQISTKTVTVIGKVPVTSTATSTPTVTSTITPVDVSTTVISTVTDTVTTTTTGTITVTNTVTNTIIIVASPTATPTGCDDHEGIQFAVYHTPAAVPNTGNGYPGFKPEAYKTGTVVNSGVTNVIYIAPGDGSGDYIDYLNMDDGTASNFVVNHRGYIFASVSGSYTFDFSNVDDAVYLWVGETAYSGWTGANDIGSVTYTYIPGGTPVSSSSGSFSVTLQSGTYTAFRILYANAQGGLGLTASITDPNGLTILNSASGASPNIVQYCANNPLAPMFAAFGMET